MTMAISAEDGEGDPQVRYQPSRIQGRPRGRPQAVWVGVPGSLLTSPSLRSAKQVRGAAKSQGTGWEWPGLETQGWWGAPLLLRSPSPRRHGPAGLGNGSTGAATFSQ